MSLPAWTRWTLLGGLICSLGLGVIGLVALMQHIEQLFLDQHIQSQADQANQVVRVLEHNLMQGKTPSDIVRQFQTQLAAMPATDTDFLCLIDPDGAVISHPNADRIGQAMSLSRMTLLENKAPQSLRHKLAKGIRTTGWAYAQPCGGAPQLVYQKPVYGTTWTLFVHRSTEHLSQRLDLLRYQILRIAIPFGICVLLGGIFLTRWLSYTQERRIKTELESVKSQYGTLIEQATDPILVVQNGKLIYQNPARERLMGYTMEEAPEHNVIEDVVPEDRRRVQEYAAQRLKGKSAPAQYTVRMIARDGRQVPLEMRPTVITYNGQPATLVVARDISERVRWKSCCATAIRSSNNSRSACR